MLQEIVSAFQQKQGFSLLIKGDAGTGKTTAGLEILVEGENPVYISTRVSPESVYGQFPWAKEQLPESAIFNATNVLLPPSDNFAAEIQRMISFQGLPKFIEAIYHKVNDKENVTTVIDSWDAVIKNDPEPHAGDKIITSLTELIRKINVNLILITESAQSTFLDYLVDGTILLEDVDLMGRRLRIMTIKKMRGVLIRNKRYLYTLQGGRINVFDPISLDFGHSKGTFQKVPTPSEGYVSSGIPDLDKVFKLPRGSTVNIEIDEYMGLESLFIPAIMLLQLEVATMDDLFPGTLDIIDHEGILAPFFKDGMVRLESPATGITLNIFRSAAAKNDLSIASSDFHVVIDAKEGIQLLYGKAPFTSLFRVVPSLDGGVPSCKLIPIV